MESERGDVDNSGVRHVVDLAIDFTAGTCGGIANVYIGQPLDTVKVKMQSFPQLYKSAVQCFTKTLKQDGIARGLYAGTVPALAANIAENSVLFAAYGFCQKGVAFVSRQDKITDLSPVHNAFAGSLAAVFASLVLCPTELVKCRLQAMREMHDIAKSPRNQMSIGPFSLTRQILRDEGARGLFKGLVPTFAREVPGYFFFFGTYEMSRYLMTPPGGSKQDIGPIKTAVCGGIGGMALWTAVFPADVVKSRVQISGKGNFVPMLLQILRKEGIGALYNGLPPTLIRSFFASGALFTAFEFTQQGLHSITHPLFN